ncbi:hypothetical protein [Marivirga arenosa]|uniref:Uncharacterized protein n=1 Tax=Marivirga arenosa TaxID=3059076 RepID=A0AA49J9E2_9BACT|nr:hypothetical protein [Marivirga sp. BKB1-2]WKK80625.2 hypothetical protein QYS47_26560 [Marivirga sp. BKB1-2]
MDFVRNTESLEVYSQYYIEAENWKSDIEFYIIEHKFMSTLINKYFTFLISKEYLDETQDIVLRLSKLENIGKDLIKDVEDFMHGVKTNLTKDDQMFYKRLNSEKEKLGRRVEAFSHIFKHIKTDVFKITEKILGNEKVKKLISAVH